MGQSISPIRRPPRGTIAQTKAAHHRVDYKKIDDGKANHNTNGMGPLLPNHLIDKSEAPQGHLCYIEQNEGGKFSPCAVR